MREDLKRLRLYTVSLSGYFMVMSVSCMKVTIIYVLVYKPVFNRGSGLVYVGDRGDPYRVNI